MMEPRELRREYSQVLERVGDWSSSTTSESMSHSPKRTLRGGEGGKCEKTLIRQFNKRVESQFVIASGTLLFVFQLLFALSGVQLFESGLSLLKLLAPA
jgi:hypothetical protein